MALNKQAISLPFNQSVNTKSDPFQLPIGQFAALTNSVFTKDGLLQKRNGFAELTTSPSGSQTLATLNDGLVILGNNCTSYNAESQTQITAGVFQPMEMSTVSMVRRATSQLNCDVTIAPTGLACSVWLDADMSSYYQISDSNTGQVVVPAVVLPATATNPRVFQLGAYFLITFIATVAGASHLQYIAVPISNPTNPGTPTDISTQANGPHSSLRQLKTWV